MSVTTQIQSALRKGDGRRARKLMRAKLRKSPQSHWLLTQISVTYCIERKYRRALAVNRQALEIAPQCPLALWNQACALDGIKSEEREAIRVWKMLLRRGVEDIAYGKCGEGKRWAQSLLNDCRFRIGRTYFKLGDQRAAIRFLTEHLSNRSRGKFSLYSIDEVRQMLSLLQNAPLRRRK